MPWPPPKDFLLPRQEMELHIYKLRMSLMSSFRHSMKLQFWSLNLLDTSALSKAL